MNGKVLLVVGFTLALVGCAEKEQAATEQTDETESADLAVESGTSAAETEDWRNSAFVDHMHAHAEHLDELNYALADGDLERAMTPAYWLSRHKTVSGVPADLQPFLVRMREAALAVSESEDLVAARAAAQQIGAECQDCHAAVGITNQ